MIIFITFFLAILGYACLTAVMLISLNKKNPIVFLRITSMIILLHVLMVWMFRYEFQFTLAVRNGYTGFIIFHSALLMILLSTLIKEKFAKTLIKISFLLVTAGAVGASFRYEVVSIYKIPVLIFAFTGIAGLSFYYIPALKKRYLNLPLK